jgi:hypothetical protein
MNKRTAWLTVRLTAEERKRLAKVARQRGYKGITPFALASLLRCGAQAETTEAIQSAEKSQAATWAAARTELARLQRTEYVLFAMLENLAKTILTYMPPPPAESRPAAIAQGKAAYERYLKAVGMSLHNGSKTAVDRLAELDG